jgi:WD40 repeat protein
MCLRSLAVLVVIVAVVGASPAQATVPGVNGLIAFEARPQTGSQITLVTPNGAFAHVLGAGGTPAWSPDGLRVAYAAISPTTRTGEIFTMAADGSDAQQLTELGRSSFAPAWSPDGTRIAFSYFSESGWDIAVINADGSGFVDLTAPGEDVWPSWSPDGRSLAFESGRDGDHEIYVMGADGGGPRDVSNRHLTEDGFPDWSPDGTRIVFVSGNANQPIDIFTVDVGTGATARLTSTGNNFYPSWSPDATQLAFASAREGLDEIYTMRADGSGVTRLTRTGYYNMFPSWQPLPVSRATTTTVSGPSGPIFYGAPDGGFTATVHAVGTPVPTGPVQFRVGGADDGDPVTLNAAGSAHHETDFWVDVGEVISATYGGDARWGWSTGDSPLQVLAAPTTTTLTTSPNPVISGDQVDVDVSVRNNASAIIPFGSVQFSIDGAPIGPRLALDEDGLLDVSLLANVPAGDYRVGAEYMDDTAPIADFQPSQASAVQRVALVTPTSTPTPTVPATPRHAARTVTVQDLHRFAARLSKSLRSRGPAVLRSPTPAFAAAAAGTLVLEVRTVDRTHTRVAAGRKTFKTAAAKRLTLKLTAAGRRLIRQRRRTRLELRTSFTPVSGTPVTDTTRASSAATRNDALVAMGPAPAGRSGDRAAG